MNKIAVVSLDIPEICSALKQFGFKLIYTESVDGFISYEKKHADMQCLSVDSKLFVLSQCEILGQELINSGFDVTYTSKLASGDYPNNILLNAQIVGKTVIGKINSLDIKLVDYLKKNDFSIVNVNQGYTACSCVKVDNNSIITADNSIYNALTNTNIDVLKIEEGNIVLHGAEDRTHGFIGGASTLIDENNLLFFGDIKKHPDYNRIKSFCESKNVSIHSINNIPLTDIGGAILLNN